MSHMVQHPLTLGSEARRPGAYRRLLALSKLPPLLLIAITSWNIGLLEAQAPVTNPLLIEQHFYAGGSVGIFDGLTTTSTYGAHFGWIGPTKRIASIGGMSPEVAFNVQYIPKVHLEGLRYIPDAIARDAVAGSVVVGPRFGGQLGSFCQSASCQMPDQPKCGRADRLITSHSFR